MRAGIRALKGAVDCEVVVAALGPRMCRLAGEEADGVLFNWLTPEYARRATEWVAAGAAAADRNVPRIYAYVRTALGPESRERLRVEASRYAAIPSYARHFARMGVDPLATAVAADDPTGIQAGLGAWEGAVDEVVVRAVTPRDALDETVELVQAAAPSL